MKRSFQRRIKRWFLEEMTRRLNQCHESHSDRAPFFAPHSSGLPSSPAEGISEDGSRSLFFADKRQPGL